MHDVVPYTPAYGIGARPCHKVMVCAQAGVRVVSYGIGSGSAVERAEAEVGAVLDYCLVLLLQVLIML